MLKTKISVLLFLFCITGVFSAGKGEAPELKAANIISSNEIKIDFEWANPRDIKNKYALYRGKSHSVKGKGKKPSEVKRPETYYFIKYIDVSAASITDNNAVEPDSIYYYSIFRIKNKPAPVEIKLKNNSVYCYSIFKAGDDTASDKIITVRPVKKYVQEVYWLMKTIPVKEKPAPSGLYIGISDFSDDSLLDGTKIKDTGIPVLFDTFKKKEVYMSQFENNYILGESKNNILYYTIHKAIKNTTGAMIANEIPRDLSINIIAVTGGPDNASSDPGLEDINAIDFDLSLHNKASTDNSPENINTTDSDLSLRGKASPDPVPGEIDYFDSSLFRDRYFLPGEKRLRDYGGFLRRFLSASEDRIKINVLIYDTGNSDVMNSAGGILGQKVKSLNDLQNESKNFLPVLKNSDRTNKYSVLNVILPPLYEGAEILIEVEKGKSVKGVIHFDADKDGPPVLQVTESNGLLQNNDDNNVRITGVREGDSFVYQFKLNKDLKSVRNKKAVYIFINKTPVLEQSSVIHIFSNEELMRNSMVLYFVLDNSVNTGEKNIRTIKDAIRSIIDSVFNYEVGGAEAAGKKENKSQIPAEQPLTGTVLPTEQITQSTQEKIYGRADLLDLLDREAGRLWIPRLTYSDSSLSSEGTIDYWVQIAAFTTKEKALENLNILHDNGYKNSSVFYKKEEDIPYKLRLGPFDTKQEAALVIDTLRSIK